MRTTRRHLGRHRTNRIPGREYPAVACGHHRNLGSASPPRGTGISAFAAATADRPAGIPPASAQRLRRGRHALEARGWMTGDETGVAEDLSRRSDPAKPDGSSSSSSMRCFGCSRGIAATASWKSCASSKIMARFRIAKSGMASRHTNRQTHLVPPVQNCACC